MNRHKVEQRAFVCFLSSGGSASSTGVNVPCLNGLSSGVVGSNGMVEASGIVGSS